MFDAKPAVDTADLDSVEVASAELPWELLQDSKVLVTGAGGFLGSALVEALLARHDLSRGKQPSQVIALVRDAHRARKRFACHPALHFIEQDLSKTLGDTPGFDFAIHAASLASPKYYGPDPVGTMLPNLHGTQQLLDRAVSVKAKGFLFISSGEVYGELSTDQIPTSETQYGYLDPTQVRSCYAESKRAGETLCVSYQKQFGLNAVIARPFHTYGPGISLDDGRVFADFVRDIVDHSDIVIKSDGSARRAFCYITDALRGLMTVLLQGLGGQAYNVGNPEGEASILELAELLVSLFPERGLSARRETRPIDGYLSSPISRNVPNVEKLRALGWAPRVGLEEGFRRTVLGIEGKRASKNGYEAGEGCSLK